MYVVIEWNRATDSGRIAQVVREEDYEYAKETARVLNGVVGKIPIMLDARKTPEENKKAE
jgi:ATP sulfurylase